MDKFVEYVKSEEYWEDIRELIKEFIRHQFMRLVEVLARDHICDHRLFRDRKAEKIFVARTVLYSRQEIDDAGDRLSMISEITHPFFHKPLTKMSKNYGRGYRDCHIGYRKPGNCGFSLWEDDMAAFEAYL
ncbi:hypothetical protein MRB53_038974 [Persea americana]|nr:hypothetical protein MRB53_038974 [Persea americana]